MMTAPYIWIMRSGIYDVLQIWDQDGGVSYFDIYANGVKCYTLEKDDDIVYVTIEDLKLRELLPEATGYNIHVIGYNSDGNQTETSNIVCWRSDGVFNNNGADPDIVDGLEAAGTYYVLINDAIVNVYLDNILVTSESADTFFENGTGYYNPLFSVNGFTPYIRNVSVSLISTRKIYIKSNIYKRYYYFTKDVSYVTYSVDEDLKLLTIYAISSNSNTSFKRHEQTDVSIGNEIVKFRNYIPSTAVRDNYVMPSDCLTFVSEIRNFRLAARYAEWDGTVEYSTDGTNWTVWDGSSITSTNHVIYLRGYDNTTFYKTNGTQLYLSGKAACYGNINTLLQYDNPPTTLAHYCYRSMFYGCTNLTQAPELPATIIGASCYERMFYYCTSLTQAPELPATALGSYCYKEMFQYCTGLTQGPTILPATSLWNAGCCQEMFSNCTSLTQAPELPATKLSVGCYKGMFQYCTSLTQAPELPATGMPSDCYAYMFSACINLTQAPELPATTLNTSCYEGMFYYCTNLTQAPELPATELAEYCYHYMFCACHNLTQSPALPATTLASYCYNEMFRGCGNLTTAPELPATTLAPYCYQYMFYYCTNLTQAPELPATELGEYCYEAMFQHCTGLTQGPTILPATYARIGCCSRMFQGCTNLTQAPELPATSLGERCYQFMFYGCTSLTQAPELPATSLNERCYQYMFYGCTSLTQSPELPDANISGRCWYANMFYGCSSLDTLPEFPQEQLQVIFEAFQYDCNLDTCNVPETTLSGTKYNFTIRLPQTYGTISLSTIEGTNVKISTKTVTHSDSYSTWDVVTEELYDDLVIEFWYGVWG